MQFAEPPLALPKVGNKEGGIYLGPWNPVVSEEIKSLSFEHSKLNLWNKNKHFYAVCWRKQPAEDKTIQFDIKCHSKGELLFSSVELVTFGVGRWLRSSSKMDHTLAQ